MLIGQFTTLLTSKRRIAVPQHLRKQLGSKLIVARWYEKCLVLVSQESWQALLQRLTGKVEIITAPVRDTDRFIMGAAFELEADGQGRILLPESLVAFAALEKEVIFIGLGDRVEIWNKNVWQAKEKYLSAHAAELVEKLVTR